MKFYTSIHRQGNYILHRGYDNGVRTIEKVWYKPSLFIQQPNSPQLENSWTTLDDRKVSPIQFNSMKEAGEFMRKYDDVPNVHVEGNTNYIAQFLCDRYPGTIEYDEKMINVCAIDIEVYSDEGFPHAEEANYPIVSITIKSNKDDKYYVWGDKDYDIDKCPYNAEYKWCETESELLTSFLHWWSDPFNTPDVITGWNSTLFDMVYIINRMNQILGEKQTKKLSPWGIIKSKSIRDHATGVPTDKHQYEIYGVSQLDFMDVFKKFTYNTLGQQESYKLDHIAHVVLGDRKLSYDEYGSLHGLYVNDYQKFIDYNIKDVELIDRMEDKLALIQLAFTIAYKTTTPYESVFGTISVWDTYLYKTLSEQRITVPKKFVSSKSEFGGGYVKDPKPGHKDWIVSFDLNSLYPHLILQYNMSPETIIPEVIPGMNEYTILEGKTNPKREYSMAATGQLFTKNKKGFIPTIIEKEYAERKAIKRQMLDAQQELADLDSDTNRYELEKKISSLDNQQMAIKIMMNALYGAMSNAYFRFFDLRIANAITTSGRLSILWIEKAVNIYMNKLLRTKDVDYVIAIDTDSVYVNFKPMVDKVGIEGTQKTVKFLDQVGSEKFVPMMQGAYEALANVTSAYANKMFMEREVIADRGIWTAKKRYILNVWNSEGVQYQKAKLKIMGIEAIKSSTPQVCRGKFKEIFPILLLGEEEQMRDFIKKFKEEFMKLPIEDISSPRGVNKLETYHNPDTIYWNTKSPHRRPDSPKSTPLHARGALLFNHYTKKQGLDIKYEQIQSGDKIKYIYLKVPNPINENVISFKDGFPKELGLDIYIDYELQFKKVFLDSLTLILNAIKWEVTPKSTLDDFFC